MRGSAPMLPGRLAPIRPSFVDGVIQHLDRDAGIQQRHRGAGPQPTRMLALGARHLLVPHGRHVATLRGRQVRKGDRERPDGAHHVHLMAEPVHVLELLVEIEPLGPAVDRQAAAGAALIAVAAAGVGRGARKVLALAELLQDRPGPPMEMGIDNVHDGAPAGTGARPGLICFDNSRDRGWPGQCN